MEDGAHSLMDRERKRPVPFFGTLAEDLVNYLAADLVDSLVCFPVGSFASLAEVVGSLVAVVVE